MSDSDSDGNAEERRRIRSVVQRARASGTRKVNLSPSSPIPDELYKREDDKENKGYDQVSHDHENSSEFEDGEERDGCRSDHYREKQDKRRNYQDNEKDNNDDDYDNGNRNKSERRRRRKHRSDSDDEGDDYRYRNRSDKRQKYRGDDSDDGQYRGSERNRRSECDDDRISRDRDKRRRDGKDDYKDRERYNKRRRENGEDKRERERRYGYSERRRRDEQDSEEREDETRKRMEGRKEEKDLEDQDKAKDKEIDQMASKEGENDGGKKKANPNNPLATRTGGAYIPPAKLRMMQESIADKSSEAYQRLSWEALKKSINGLINKVNTPNISNIVRELFQENIVRGRGVLAQSIVRAQTASPTFSHVYAALVAIINTKFPKDGELILRRLVLQFRRAFRRNDKVVCLSNTRFIAHLVNQQVAHEILALEILTLLLQKPTDDSVEVAIGFLKECGSKLTEVSPRGIHAVFERLRSILHGAELDKRVQYMIEVMFAIRKDGFKDHLSVVAELDLVEEEDQITHLLRLEEAGNAEDILNIFKMDPNFLENEEKYKEIKRDILGESSDDSSGDGEGDSDDDDDEDDNENEGEGKMEITDMTETNLVALRRTIYLTIQSSLDYEECAHKLLKMNIKAEQMEEFCTMVVDCCAQQRTYEKFFGLLGQRFCQLNKEYMEHYMRIFREQYDTIHRMETNKLRNVAKFFAHLLFTDAIAWTVLACISLNEEDTTSSSRIFIKILFQELAEYMGLPRLNDRLKDPFLAEYFEGLFPRDNPRNTRFAINFFTAIGLGGLTDELREHLKNAPKMIMAQKQQVSSDSDSSDSDSSDDSSDTEESSSESSSSESDDARRKRKSKKRSTPPKKERSRGRRKR